MNLEKDIPRLEKELREGQEAYAKLSSELEDLLGASRDKETGCIQSSVWSRISKLQADMSTIEFDIQDHPLTIKHLKRLANSMARKAYVRNGAKGTPVYPYPEER